MLRLLLLLISISICNSIYGQVYTDSNGKEITKKQFEKIVESDYLNYIEGTRVHKGLIENRLIKRKQTGILAASTVASLNQLAGSLSNGSKKEILLFNYSAGDDECAKSRNDKLAFFTRKNKRYQNLIDLDGGIKQYYIYKNETYLKDHQKYAQWHKDPKQLLTNLFFEYKVNCGGHIIIKGNTYLIYYGESYPEFIMSQVKELRSQ